jgi:hypothetical protein
MSYNLETVSDYITDARTLLLDTISPFRYDDKSLLIALNLALMEGRRVRPDLFVYKHGNRVPHYDSVSGAVVPIEPQFRKAFVYGLASHALARDQEDVQDQRSNAFMQVMMSILTGGGGAPISGGTPGGQQQRGGGMQLPNG